VVSIPGCWRGDYRQDDGQGAPCPPHLELEIVAVIGKPRDLGKRRGSRESVSYNRRRPPGQSDVRLGQLAAQDFAAAMTASTRGLLPVQRQRLRCVLDLPDVLPGGVRVLSGADRMQKQ
jgi:hypothetical protein